MSSIFSTKNNMYRIKVIQKTFNSILKTKSLAMNTTLEEATVLHQHEDVQFVNETAGLIS